MSLKLLAQLSHFITMMFGIALALHCVFYINTELEFLSRI